MLSLLINYSTVWCPHYNPFKLISFISLIKAVNAEAQTNEEENFDLNYVQSQSCSEKNKMIAEMHKMFITNYFLDRGFRNMLLPFQCMQHMFFLSSFSIKHNCIRTPTLLYYIVSLIGTLGFILLHILIHFTSGYLVHFSSIINFFATLSFIALVIAYFIIYSINILKRKDNIQMVLKIQNVIRVIYYKHYKRITIWNWISLSLHFVVYVILVSGTRDFWGIFFFYSLYYFHVSVIYGIRMIALIRDGMKTWISEVEYYGNLCFELEEKKYNDNLKKLLQAYIDLMEAFNILKDISKFSVNCQNFLIFYI